MCIDSVPGRLLTMNTPERSVSRLLCIGAVLTLVVRPAAWRLTFGSVWPLFGFFDFVAWDGEQDFAQQQLVMVAVWTVPAVAVVTALTVALFVRRGSARAAQVVPALGAVFLVATAVYLASLVVLAVVSLNGDPDTHTAVVAAVVAAMQFYLLFLSQRLWRYRPAVS